MIIVKTLRDTTDTTDDRSIRRLSYGTQEPRVVSRSVEARERVGLRGRPDSDKMCRRVGIDEC